MSERIMLTEPVTRPDGESFVVERLKDGIAFNGSFSTIYYPIEDVILLGGGHLHIGIQRIGQSIYEASINDLLIGTRKMHVDEI